MSTRPDRSEREPRPEKVAAVDDVHKRLEESSAVLVTEYRGLKVAELAELRSALAGNATLKIYKNTLVSRAARATGHDALTDLLIGPTGIAFVTGDAAAAAKALKEFAKTHQALVVKGGTLGSKALSAADADALASLPSREVLLAQIAGGFAAPMQKFAGLLQALPRNFAYGLKALIDQKNAA